MAKDDSDLIATAKKQFEYALSRSSENRQKAKEDIRFAASSPDDPWQWDTRDAATRKLQMRPMLTINKMPQHIRQVTNDIRQNRPSIKYRPADSKADPEVAEILMGLARHIEANSDADIAYDTAAEHQVVHGIGYIRVLADYISDDSFDQDIFIGRIKNPFKCFDDPDIQDPAGADRKFFFIEEMVESKDFAEQYPDADPIDWTFTDSGDGWFTGDKKVRIVEWFTTEEKEADLYLWTNGSTSYKGDPLPQGVFVGERPIKTRKATKCTVKWRKLNGQQVLDEKDFPCKYIPFARVVGNEWEVDGKNVVSGIVRNAKDSQRMYNVAQSAIVERVMQAPKAPWVAAFGAIDGFESVWQTANTANHSYLPFNHTDESDKPIPAPTRTQPATVEPGLAQIATGASDDIKSETGQYDASLGQRSNETSGKAIMARQREGDVATYHYVDNLGRAVRHVGRIVLDMIPRIYDTKRIARIIGEDDSAANVTLDPEAQEPLQEYKDERGEIQRIFNPNIGTYDVYTTTGPSFTTRRVEAVEAMTAMTQANPELWGVIGDLLVKNMDWPGAEEMAERLKVTLNPAVQQIVDKDKGEPEIPPQLQMAMQQMQQQLQEQHAMLQQAGKEVETLTADSKNKADELLIKAYEAETKRLQALGTTLTPEAVQALVMQTVSEALNSPLPDGPPAEQPPMQAPQGAFSLPEGQTL